MENASKALIMAAEILVGVMIIGVGGYLFNLFASYSSNEYEKMESVQIAEFNAQFLQYYGSKTDEQTKKLVPVECTIHDIVSLANLAQKHNLQYELILENSKVTANNQFSKKANITLENSLYIQIDLGNIQNLELKTNQYLIDLIKANDLKSSVTGEKSEMKLYKCMICEPRGDNRRINYVKFVEIP